ncbi:MAG TPA: hypothetical protein VHV82_15765 [Sporichthyaceae bacterium]|jgi:hypothetical protein|nr:hypothetical protein [Sporichthyaceae bacterium]
MNERFAIVVDEADPCTVLITGRIPDSGQAQFADALARAVRGSRCRLDLTGLEALHVAARQVLFVLAQEVDLELLIRSGGPVAHAVHASGLDRLVIVHEVFTLRAQRKRPSIRTAASA